jgi:hypothetical protein
MGTTRLEEKLICGENEGAEDNGECDVLCVVGKQLFGIHYV